MKINENSDIMDKEKLCGCITNILFLIFILFILFSLIVSGFLSSDYRFIALNLNKKLSVFLPLID